MKISFRKNWIKKGKNNRIFGQKNWEYLKLNKKTVHQNDRNTSALPRTSFHVLFIFIRFLLNIRMNKKCSFVFEGLRNECEHIDAPNVNIIYHPTSSAILKAYYNWIAFYFDNIFILFRGNKYYSNSILIIFYKWSSGSFPYSGAVPCPRNGIYA